MALTQRIRSALDFAPSTDEVERDEETRAMWRKVYPDLIADRPGRLAALLNRCEAQAVGLSVTHALLGRAPTVRRAHLQAAVDPGVGVGDLAIQEVVLGREQGISNCTWASPPGPRLRPWPTA